MAMVSATRGCGLWSPNRRVDLTTNVIHEHANAPAGVIATRNLTKLQLVEGGKSDTTIYVSV